MTSAVLSPFATPREAGARPSRASAAASLSWAALALLLTTSACAPTARLTPTTPPPAVTAAPSTPAVVAHVETMLRAEVEQWRGTPHVLGGEDRNGLDCSAFVRNVYDDLFDVRLPRTTKEQAGAGQAVRDALRPGDLVFFRPRAKARHVGIYLSGDEFAHVSSSEGVTVSSLSDAYWRDAYWTTRRILGDPAQSLATADRTHVQVPVQQPVQEPVQEPARQDVPPRASDAAGAIAAGTGRSEAPRRIGW